MDLTTGRTKGKFRLNKNKAILRLKQFIAATTIVIFLVLIYVLSAFSPVAGKSAARDVTITIPPQATAGQVGYILKQNKLVRNSMVFSLYARYKGMDSAIKAGDYRISNGLSMREVLKELVDGRLNVQTFTIPEGLTTSQVADLLAGKGLVDRKKFMSAVSISDFNYKFLSELPKGEKRLEGYLFPDTYQVTGGSSESTIIDLMLRRFDMEIKDLDYTTKAQLMGLTLHQAVTIASMVEREAKLDEERPIIAGVIYNRIGMSIPLQIDATVQYSLGTSKSKIYYKDLETDSPYNTYKNRGLPPGPISMPGKASLLAAVSPEHTNYIYYVAKPDGSHAFSTTLAEHNANKERYLQ